MSGEEGAIKCEQTAPHYRSLEMDALPFYILYNSISVISGRWTGDNERLCVKKPHFSLIINTLITKKKLNEHVTLCHQFDLICA